MGKSKGRLLGFLMLPLMLMADEPKVDAPFCYPHQKPQHFSMIYPYLREVGDRRDYIIGDVVHQIVLGTIQADVQVESLTAVGYMLQQRPASFDFTTNFGGERAFFYALQEVAERGVSEKEVAVGKKQLQLLLSFDDQQGQKACEMAEVIESLSRKEVQEWMAEHLRARDFKMHYYRFTGPYATVQVRLVSKEFEEFKLTISEREQECIYTIIKTMGTHSVFGLLKKKKMLTKMGDEIDGVPPLQFLGYIFTHPELPKYMPKIKASVFKWKNLIDGLGRTMRREYDEGKLQPQIGPFAKAVGVDASKLKARMDKSDPEGFVVELMQ